MGLALLVDVLLLLPSIVKDVEDTPHAREDEKGVDDDEDDQESVDVVDAVPRTLEEAPNEGVDTVADGHFPVAGEGVDHENQEHEQAESIDDCHDVVDQLAGTLTVRLENNHSEDASECELEGEWSPLPGDSAANCTEQVEHAHQDRGGRQGHAAAAAPEIVRVDTHYFIRIFINDKQSSSSAF